LIRAYFAAIEGLIWMYREHVVDIAKSCDKLTFEEQIAFAEVTYAVTAQGRIVEQARFVPMLALIRLTTKLAEKINPTLKVHFNGTGWDSLRQAVEIRNRITHPKSVVDLEISDMDLKTCRGGFDWLFEMCTSALETSNLAFGKHVQELANLVDELRRGDPHVIAEYNAVAKSLRDQESF
jgi:hypothetical protein